MNDELSPREIILQMINICTRVVTLIFAISTIFLSILNPDFTGWDVKDILYVLLIGVISGLLFIIYFIPKKIGKKMMILLETIYFLAINITVLIIGAKLNWYDPTDKLSLGIMEGMIIAIYIIVFVTTYALDRHQAEKMNDLLKKRKINKVHEE